MPSDKGRQCGPTSHLQTPARRRTDFRERSRCLCQGRSVYGRIRTQTHPHYPASTRRIRPPDGAVIRVDCDTVKAEVEAFVFAGIDRGIGLDVIVAFAVAVGVDDEWSPALRFSGVARLQEYAGVDPAQFRAAIVGKI